MRLLRCSNDGGVTLAPYLASGDAIPSYAILSHTWQEGEEVTYDEIIKDSTKDKAGYDKIRFCAQQAKRDGLDYIWVDTCCINKMDQVELREAISSMFRWYKNAARCYAFLSDVPYGEANTGFVEQPWATAFRASRWFTRGWTLQELLAPASVEFFSKEWRRLGDKTSLQTHICEATRIPNAALQGTPLLQFSIDERLKWSEHRKTKVPEDRAYCLIGILGVQMTPFYGEGVNGAFTRLMNEADILNRCLQDLRPSDPHDDKKRIEDTKGGLLQASYRWVLQNNSFQRWCDDPHRRLLWVKGDAGKGKTMLLCGIVDELKNSTTRLLSFFFCQGTDSRINSATAVLRGLIYLLVSQQPSLMSHLRKKYDQAGGSLFQDANSWVALSDIFTSMAQDVDLKISCLVIDALDECVVDLPKLLDLIVRTTMLSTRIKWLVSSRNEAYIEQKFKSVGDEAKLNLELKQNAEQVAQAVDVYIDYKLSRLESLREDSLREQVRDELHQKANGTFLWVALMVQELEGPESWDPLEVVKEAPAGLNQLYDSMMDRIQQLKRSAEICRLLLFTAAVAYRPLYLAEMGSLRGLAGQGVETVRKIIAMCGSFLTVRDEQVYLVHQSAKDYLSGKMQAAGLPSRSEMHHGLFSRSLELMSSTLKRDMYNLVEPGFPINEVEIPNPDPLATTRYSCVHWVDHLHDSIRGKSVSYNESIRDDSAMHVFLRKHYLYWLEALSLCKSMSAGVMLMTELATLVQGAPGANRLTKLIQDAQRFIMYHKVGIENSPLQAYMSALVFSPTDSLIQRYFQHERLRQVVVKPALGSDWSACVQTLEGRNGFVTSVVFSHDSSLLASASYGKKVKVWKMSSGECVHTLVGHSSYVYSVVFSHDSTLLASASDDKNVKVWKVSSGECVYTLVGHSGYVLSAVFSHDSTLLASASSDKTIKVWKVSSGECVHTLMGHSSVINSVVFSHNSTLLASASYDKTVKVWKMSSSECVRTLVGHSTYIYSVVFSHDSTLLASASGDKKVKVWKVSSGECTHTLEGHSDSVLSVAFSHNSTLLASASEDTTVKVWKVIKGECLETLEGHSNAVNSVVFSHDSTLLASASRDTTVKLWKVSSGEYVQMLKGHSTFVYSVVFSHDSTLLASASGDKKVKVWKVGSGECVHTLEGHSDSVLSVAFSHNSTLLASTSYDKMVKVWKVSSGECVHTLVGHSSYVYTVVFSHDSMLLASGSKDKTVKVWKVSSGECVHTLEDHDNDVMSVAFSHDSTLLASASSEGTVKLWKVSSSKCMRTINVGQELRKLLFSATGSCLHTDKGDIALDTAPSLQTADAVKLHALQYSGWGVSRDKDKAWITRNGKNTLWLPSEYRPGVSAVSGSTVSIGVGSGRVWMCCLL